MSRWWVQGLAYGLFFGVAMTLFFGLRQGEWVGAVVGGAVGGLLFGATMGAIMSRLNRRLLGELATLAPDQLRTVVRASSRGPRPADPQLRAAAKRLVDRQRREALRARRSSVAICAVLIALYVVLALTQSWWWGLGGLLFLSALLLTLRAPARLERRSVFLDTGEEAIPDPHAS